MNYISTTQASELWGITANRISILAKEGRIPGAVQIGSRWMIPENTEKPADARTRNAGKTVPDFRFPFFIDQDLHKYNPPLSDEEQQLSKAQLLFTECRFSEASEVLENIPETSDNIYIRINTLFHKCMLCTMGINADKIQHYLNRIEFLMKNDFPYKEEMTAIQYAINITIGSPAFNLPEFRVTPDYNYHKSALPAVMTIASYYFVVNCINSKYAPDYPLYEIICHTLENDGCYFSAQLINLCLCFLYSAVNDMETAKIHLRKALKIAESRNLYYTPAVYYSYLGDMYDIVLPEFPKEFADRITSLGEMVHNNYVNFMRRHDINHVYNLISRHDFQYIIYAVQGVTNKDLSEMLHLSESTIAKKYSKIYDLLGVSSKNELKDLFIRLNNTKIFDIKAEN